MARLWKDAPLGRETTATVRDRVIAARAFSGRPVPNAKLAGMELREAVRLTGPAERLLSDAAGADH